MLKPANDNSKISYHAQSRLTALAVLIENARSKVLQQGAVADGVRAIISGEDDDSCMAAAMQLASSLGLSHQSVDISELYIDYCGEAENRLEQMLAGAQDADSLVYFHQLDHIFGHDPDWANGHERHVRLDAGYFINTLARYDVPVILRTRAYHRLDQAILRQFSCVIDLDEGAVPVERRVS